MGEKKLWEARASSPLLRCSVQAKAFTLGSSLSYNADMPMPGHMPHWQWLWLENMTSWLDLSSASLWQTSLVIWTWPTLVTATGSAPLFVFGYCSIGCLPCQWGHCPGSLAVTLSSHPHPSCYLKLGLSRVFVQLSNLLLKKQSSLKQYGCGTMGEAKAIYGTQLPIIWLQLCYLRVIYLPKIKRLV